MSILITPETLAASDCLVIACDRPACDYGFVVSHSKLVLDIRNATKDVTVGREKIVQT